MTALGPEHAVHCGLCGSDWDGLHDLFRGCPQVEAQPPRVFSRFKGHDVTVGRHEKDYWTITLQRPGELSKTFQHHQYAVALAAALREVA
jgi:hypothetical protein